MVIVSNWRNPVVEQHSDYSSFHRIIKNWNSLPEGAVLPKDVNELKSKITNTGTKKSFMFFDQLICQFDIYYCLTVKQTCTYQGWKFFPKSTCPIGRVP